MTHQAATFPYAGIYLDGVLDTETGETYLSLTSTAAAIGKRPESPSEFLASKRPEALPFKGSNLRKTKIGKAAYTLVPTTVASAYWAYWATKGNEQARALTQAIVQADLERSIKEANGVSVTAAQHEATRSAIRHHLLQQWADAYNAGDKAKVATEATPEEKQVVFDMVTLKRLEDQMAAPPVVEDGVVIWEHTSETLAPLQRQREAVKARLEALRSPARRLS